MANSSKLFYALVALLVLIIGGLSLGIFQQRQASEQITSQTKLEAEKQALTLLADQSRVIVEKLPELKTRTEEGRQQLDASAKKRFLPADRAALETVLKQAALAARLEPGKFESSGTSPSGAFIAHTFSLKMVGALNALPAFIDALSRSTMLIQVAQVGVNAPDFKLARVKLTAMVRVFEAKDPAAIAGPTLPEARLSVDTAWHQSMSGEDPVYGQALKDVDALAAQVNERLAQVKEAAGLEKQLMGVETILAELKALETGTKRNRRLAVDGLPALYARVQSSPLGSVAMVISDQKVSYPETAGDD